MARISDFKEENQVFVPELIIQEASEAINKVVPAKSKQLYEKEYSNFCEWRKRKDAKGVDERIILAYISERSKNAKSSSLWAYYSQLKKMLSVKENIDMSRFNCTVLLTLQDKGSICNRDGNVGYDVDDELIKLIRL
ncbi:hypothetical protein TcasGA2_TC003662 [Tribolium castaneum]|uniref:Uncharacterized protein n=1 Tax=Tribolium castaneum TaxID=7070 RepID=D6WDI1_TRICA|nr:hypothetical protein TcasGA2_TC003662 [Tribolium castaneum]